MAKAKTIPDQIRNIIATGPKSAYQIAQETGLSESTLSDLKKEGWGRQIETAQKVLAATGHELVIKKKSARPSP